VRVRFDKYREHHGDRFNMLSQFFIGSFTHHSNYTNMHGE